MRGSRGEKNSRTMLLPLIRDFGSSVTVALYHTPALRGIAKRLLPERFNETVGVNHMKVYVFDDTVIISGANLSELYFTQRQDRYVILHNARAIGDFFDELIARVQRYSFHLQADDSVRLADDIACHPFADRDGGKKYRSKLGAYIKELIRPKSTSFDTTADTVIYPLIQMGPANVTVDEQVTNTLFRRASSDVTIYLASGYFNLTDHYMHSITNDCTAAFRILTASPQANGFYGSKGVSGAIPDAYTYIAKKFYDEVVRSNQQSRISLHEYSRQGWTVHSKGLWYYLPGQNVPSMSMVGSPNFGHRSVYRDLEAQIVIVTKNRPLQQQLHQEQVQLYARSSPVCRRTFTHPERLVPRWVTFVTPLIRNFF
jgi:CDP-diacylglycerol--glycerol-3-phosphate 3-phosphatidyltransferase